MMLYLHGALVHVHAVECLQGFGRAVGFGEGDGDNARHASTRSIGKLNALDGSNGVAEVFLENKKDIVVSPRAAARIHKEHRRSRSRQRNRKR